jgi:hypothetical protein
MRPRNQTRFTASVGIRVKPKIARIRRRYEWLFSQPVILQRPDVLELEHL